MNVSASLLQVILVTMLHQAHCAKLYVMLFIQNWLVTNYVNPCVLVYLNKHSVEHTLLLLAAT